ncbi:MAG TPA: type II toxin-antitoxin system prevent-host-death family antitoxin [Candidatus Acidoferrum sp.]|nr:type II toxin-antitoxin system prevent-host-death family antitoxin [Candidatus Acidoferrum sp.]
MKEMRASVFKSRCLKVMDRVQATGEPVIVTKRGKPVVKVIPVEQENDDIFGFMKGKFEIVGDIVSPVTPIEDWEALKD